MNAGARAVFVDRDGVLNELVPDPASGRPESPLRVEDVVLTTEAAAALTRLARAGWLLVGISNQPAAAKGLIAVDQLRSVQARVLRLLSAEGVRFHDFRLCLHHPDGVVPELSRRCDCRKPAPGMLLESARTNEIDLASSWIVGDTDGDVLAGRAAGCRTILVEHSGSVHKRTAGVTADAVVATIGAAAELIVSVKE